jgi:phosphoribosylformylglycinamidine cyclo-ligase
MFAEFPSNSKWRSRLTKTYKDAGVDIDAAENSVRNIKSLIRSTFTSNVLSDIGLFGGFFEPDFSQYKNPVLVSSVDGVGTKLKIAALANKHDTIGQDLVNHCVNDIAVCGAVPLFFMDYFAAGKLEQRVFEDVVRGFVEGCKTNHCALIGGETAEMPGLYQGTDYDLAGMIVGVVDKGKIIDGSHIKEGDILIGLPANGLHTNGYSLVRSVLLESFKIDDYIDELGCTLGEELLRVHRSYLDIIRELIQTVEPKGFAHITGGGIITNTMRVIPEGLTIAVKWDAWEIPAVFRLIQSTGNVATAEMRRVFNQGIGLVIIIRDDYADKAVNVLFDRGEQAYILGEVVNASSSSSKIIS